MNTLLSDLKPTGFWQIFQLICSIPHPSGHEHALAKALEKLALQAGLTARFDEAGNLRIDRTGAPGLENRPTVILHGHLDMVPKSRPDGSFDFVNTPITPVVEGEYVRACDTTLGADDGAGVALAMSMLLDKDLRCGPVAGLFTVAEEIGLIGAQKLAPDMLCGDYLLTMDRGDEDHFCIGCAGGVTQDFTWELPWESAPKGVGVKIKLSGLAGGHSGVCIHEKRGNSLLLLINFLARHPELKIHSISGGDADNAIPNEAEFYGVLTSGDISLLQKSAQEFVLETKRDLVLADNYQIEVSKTDMAKKVWKEDFSTNWLNYTKSLPNGPIKWLKSQNIVHTSSNFAAIKIQDNILTLITSQRSLSESDKNSISQKLVSHLTPTGAKSSIRSPYPGWEPREESPFLKLATMVRNQCDFPNPVRIEAIHAGLEAGILSKLNPELEILSCGVTDIGAHTADEKLPIASVERMDKFVRKLVESLA